MKNDYCLHEIRGLDILFDTLNHASSRILLAMHFPITLTGDTTCKAWLDAGNKCNTGRLLITAETSPDIDTKQCYQSITKKDHAFACEKQCCASKQDTHTICVHDLTFASRNNNN